MLRGKWYFNRAPADESLGAIVDQVLGNAGIDQEAPMGEPAATPAPEATPEPIPAPAAEAAPETEAPEIPTTPEPPADPEIEVPGIGAMKASEIARLKSEAMMQSDYTRKTQELAAERQAIAQQQAKYELERQQFESTQKQHEQLQLHPLANPDNWMQQRLREYQQAGWDMNNPEHVAELNQRIPQELSTAQMRALQDNQANLVRELQRRDLVQQAELSKSQQTREIEQHLAKPEFAQIRNDDGRDLVRKIIAAEVAEGKPADVQGAVAAVGKIVSKMLHSYVQTKQSQARGTAPLMRGGGAAKAPDPRQYKVDRQELYDAAEEFARGSSS